MNINLKILSRTIKIFFVIILLALNLSPNYSQNSWSTLIDSVSTLSSPRAADLNSDGTKDIVLGGGTDSTYSNYGVVALDGVSGQLLWNLPTPDEIFTSAVFNDINNDTIPDVFIGGRNAQLYAIDGSNGNIIWEFFPQNSGLNPADSGLYNFYSSQICNDFDGDNVQDILVTNGGDHKAAPFDPRPPGHLMLISGATGNLIAKAVSPDSAEIYSSPVILSQSGVINTESIVFGTGGEQHGGGMYVTNFTDLLNGDISSSIILTTHPAKGFIAPASLADVSDDGFIDIVVQSFSGKLSAFDGITFQTLWSKNFPGCESSAAPTIGNFTGGDLVPDVFTVVYRGTSPTYFDFYQVMLDGLTGEISWIDSVGSMHYSSSSAFDANGDGRDEVLFSVNYISSYFSHQLKMVDFQNDSVMDVTSLNAGVNLGCSPLIEDLDEDGLLEFIYTYKYDSLNPSAWNGFYFNRTNTNFSTPYRGIAWGAYMGTSFSGNYTRNLSLCPNSNMISSWNITQPSCNNFNDGSVYPSIINNYPNTYLWSDGTIGDTLKNVSQGLYTLFITDTNNCVEYHQFQLNDPYVISFGNITHNNCIGDSIGTATVASSGCVCQFSTCTYLWDNGSLIKHAINLPSGMQHVIITHPDGCIVEDSIFINDGLPVVDSSLVSNKSCFYSNDGQIELFPNNPSTTNYTWSNSASQNIISQLSSGPYWVIVNNTFCSDSLYFNILSPDSIFVNYSYQDVLCYGDSNGTVELSPTSGFSPFSYVMDGIIYSDSLFENLSIGNYQFYLKDSSNCNSDTVNLVINQPDSLEVTFTVVPESDSGFFDGSVIASGFGGTSPYFYTWSHNPNINDSIILYLSNDYYTLNLSDLNGCQLLDSVYVGIVSDNNLLSNDFLKIYPIPSTGNIYLNNYSNELISIKIFDLSGKLVKNSFLVNPFDKYAISLPKGHFVAEIKNRNSLSFQKIIILD